MTTSTRLFDGRLFKSGLFNGGLFANSAESAPAVNPNFVFTIDTTKAGSTGSSAFRIPMVSGSVYDFNVDWGDGSNEDVSGSALTAKNHTYSSPGIYTITISGTFPRIYFNNGGDKLKVLSTQNLGAVGWTSFVRAFYGCSNQTVVEGDVDWGTVTDVSVAWHSNNLTSWTIDLPSSLTDCQSAWYSNNLTSWTIDLPSSLANCQYSWYSNNLTAWTGGGWAGVTNATNAVAGGTNNINTTDYNALLVTIEANNQHNNVPFHFGLSKHSGAGTIARAALIADHSDTFTDGGAA